MYVPTTTYSAYFVSSVLCIFSSHLGATHAYQTFLRKVVMKVSIVYAPTDENISSEWDMI